MLHITKDVQPVEKAIKKVYINRMDEDYKNIWHFTYHETYYVVPNEYEVYAVCLKLVDEDDDYIFLFPLKYGQYKGSFKKAIKDALASMFPKTWDIDVIKRWCEETTADTLSMCHVIK